MLFTGRLTANAEVNAVKGDRTVTNFTVALNQRFKTRDGEKREKTAFVDCAYWVNPKLAEYLTKGAVVQINGWVDAQSWTNRKGENNARLVCNVDKIDLLSTIRETAAAAPAAGKAKSKATQEGAPDDDDLPF